MARNKTDNTSKPNPRLVKPRSELRAQIAERIVKGKAIRDSQITLLEHLEAADSERGKWDRYNTELLERSFDNSAPADEYSFFGVSVGNLNSNFPRRIDEFKRAITDKIERLESLSDRLDLIPEADIASTLSSVAAPAKLGRKVFVVHGQDEGAKLAAVRFLEKLGLIPVVLHEQPDSGMTIIEKFEEHASDVAFAVVLLTPDDLGASIDQPINLHARARQNVVFELGYFTGKLGRSRVRALYKGDLELPSNYQGVLYLPLTPDGGWRLRLAGELRAAGINVDLNKAS